MAGRGPERGPLAAAPGCLHPGLVAREQVEAVWEVLRAEVANPSAPLRPPMRTYNTLMRALSGGIGPKRVDGNKNKQKRKRSQKTIA